MKKCLTLFILFFTIIGVYAQIGLTIETPVAIDKAIAKLAGKGVIISGITYNCPSEAFGEFDDVLGEIGLDKGLLMTNGSAKEVGTTNNSGSSSKQYGATFFDKELENSLNDAGIFNVNLNDGCVIEFDIIPATTEISFRYVFGSEEYPEFVNSGYSDAFGFFITGEFEESKGIQVRNLAVVPNTTDIVSVESINDSLNSQYYIDNQVLKGLPGDKLLEYDGYTVPLIAKTKVIPCKKYRMKLVIADFGDDRLDSGVLIEAGSFVSEGKPLVEIEYEHKRFPHLIEGCNDGKLIFKRPEYTDISKDLTVNYLIKGTAENGIDYQKLTNSIMISKNKQEASYSLIPFVDAEKEGLETIQIDILNICPEFPIAYSLTVPLREDFDYPIENPKICWGDVIQLNQTAIKEDSLIWKKTPNLSCLQCSSPFTKNVETETFPVTVIDKNSLCKIEKELTVEVLKVEANFSFVRDEDYTSLDYQFTNLSKNAQSYFWDFGDTKTSTQENPFHYFPFDNLTQDQQKYTIKLIAKSSFPVCYDTIQKDILIEEPLFIPNIISPNQDLKNETFLVQGIIYRKWTFEVYNRWGKMVYLSKGYENEWTADNVRDGVYYFVLKNPKGDRIYNGWVEILR